MSKNAEKVYDIINDCLLRLEETSGHPPPDVKGLLISTVTLMGFKEHGAKFECYIAYANNYIQPTLDKLKEKK